MIHFILILFSIILFPKDFDSIFIFVFCFWIGAMYRLDSFGIKNYNFDSIKKKRYR